MIWILDSCDSISTTNDINSFINLKKCDTNIILADGKEIHSSYIGDFEGYIDEFKLILKDVFYSKFIKKKPNINKSIN